MLAVFQALKHFLPDLIGRHPPLLPGVVKVVGVALEGPYHARLGGSSVGRKPLATHFLRGVLRLRPA
ncbi:hypothetical protein M9458_043627, partial [Cirrhinus mrigala]